VNGSIVGHFTNSGNIATNDPFISPSKLSADTIRPGVELVDANPNPYNPNLGLFQMFYSLSENSNVILNVYYGSVTIKTLTATGFAGYNSPIFWDGLSNTGTLQADGDFSYSLDTIDMAGNTGRSYTGDLKITTVQLTTDIFSVDTRYSSPGDPQVAVEIHVHDELKNATPANLALLGFSYADNPPVTHNFRNYPYVYHDVRIYDNFGNTVRIFHKDIAPLIDSDVGYVNMDIPNFGSGTMIGFPPANVSVIQLPLGVPCSITTTVLYYSGDTLQNNDWDMVFAPGMTLTAMATPGFFTANPVFYYYGTNIAAGSYIASIHGILVGKEIFQVDSAVHSSPIPCASGSSTTANYSFLAFHAQPSYFFDETTGAISDSRGFGLSSVYRTAGFVVEPPNTPPVPDSTPPLIVTSSEFPSNGIVVQPNVIGPTNYLRILLTDNGVGAGPTNLSSISLADPFGNSVAGHIAWNGGIPGTKNWEVYFVPDRNITLGGRYVWTVVPVDALLNIGLPATYTFTVADTSIPVVNNINVQSNSGTTTDLSLSVSTQIAYLVSQINCTLITGGTVGVDWANSTITVRDVNGNLIAGVVSHPSSTNNLQYVPAANLSDGNYSVVVTAQSLNGYSGAYRYNFYVTTAGVTYIDLNGTGETSATVMRISLTSPVSSGITDNTGAAVPAIAVSASTFTPPAAPASYKIFSNSIQFRAATAAPAITYQFPLKFNVLLCTAVIRMHYTDTNVNALKVLGLTEADLTLWVNDGTAWTQITNAGKPVANAPDHYIEFSVTSVPANNVYALMYVQPVIPSAQLKFNTQNTKAFNPAKGNAKIYYTDTLSFIDNVKVSIYSMGGTLVRYDEYKKSQTPFAGYDTDPYSGNTAYYYAWDGKNNSSSYVRNGMYALKMEIKKTTGTSYISRLIAVVK
jgi:hypothetical protein